MHYNLINQFIFFIIYGFFGFLLESSFRSFIRKRTVISRGFLTNFFCPLYGTCGILISQIFLFCEIFFYNKLNGLFIATISSIAIITILEYAVGFILDRIFKYKLWDYSNNPFNLHGYICLEFSLMWGIVAIILSSFIHPIIEIIVINISDNYKIISVFIIFILISINTIFNTNKHFRFNDNCHS